MLNTQTRNFDLNYQSLELVDIISNVTGDTVLNYLNSVTKDKIMKLEVAIEQENMYKTEPNNYFLAMFVDVLEEILKIQAPGLSFHYSEKKYKYLVHHIRNLMNTIFELQKKRGEKMSFLEMSTQYKNFGLDDMHIPKHKLISNKIFLDLLRTSPKGIRYIQLCMLTYPSARTTTGIRFNAYRDHLKVCINYYMCAYLSLRLCLIPDLSQTIISLILDGC